MNGKDEITYLKYVNLVKKLEEGQQDKDDVFIEFEIRLCVDGNSSSLPLL